METRTLRAWWQKHQFNLASIAFILLFFIAFFAKVFVSGRFIITGDPFYYSYPLRTVAWDMIGSGQLPLWTPLFLSGYPLLAVAQLGLGYPITWFHLFLPGHVAEQIYAMAPFVIAPITTFAYLRAIGRSYLASIFGGLAFAYGGMMCGILANSGMLTNGFAWAPLILIFVDRARTRSFVHCVVWASLTYGLAVLGGHGQSYVYVGLLVLAYGLFTSISLGLFHTRSWNSWSTWRPLSVAFGSLPLAGGIAAFQLLEVLRVARRSIRSALPYEVFSEGSFSIREAFLSLGAPIYHYIDSGTYLTPLAFVIAVVAVVAIVRRRINDERVWFWLIVAAVAWLLLLGSSTPLNRLVYHVPVLNGFRVPSRHTFEWTLAISVLAAYGWDVVEHYFRERSQRATTINYKPIVALSLIAAAAIVGLLFWRVLAQLPEPNRTIHTGLPEQSYWWWKFILTVLVLAAAVFSFQITRQRTRVICLTLVIGLACFVEANATVNCWWAGILSLPAERFHVVSTTTRYLQQFPPEQNRVYTRIGLFAEEFTNDPRLEAMNLTMLYNLQNVAGMEPLILERYSRALGNVGPDSVTGRAGMPYKNDLFLSPSHVLDILNTTHAVTFAGPLGIYADAIAFHDGVGLSVGELNVSVAPGQSADFSNRQKPADELALVTSLSNSAAEPDDKPIARVRFFTEDGRTIDRDLLPGTHTAEWAHERPDIRSSIKHQLATVFDQRPGDAENTFASYRYWARLKLDASERIERVQITNLSQTATISLWKLSLLNSQDRRALPLWLAPSPAWTEAFEDRGVEVLKNNRALPRAWLVTQAHAVDGEEALRAIRGESLEPFDPRETVLLEVRPDELPKLPGGKIDASSEVRLTGYQPTRLTIETSAPTNTVLVVSEIFYPGWKATVDGQPARIMLADYLLRGIALAAGKHKVDMNYSAPSGYLGPVISISTLASLIFLGIYGQRKERRQA